MDLNAYISSGILESYALCATTLQENADVETMVAQYPELASELSQIQEAMEQYALLYEQTPPAGLKEKTLEAIFGVAIKAPKANFTIEKNESSFSKLFNWRVAASWILLVGSIGGNIYLFNEWKSTESKLVVAQSQNTEMAQNEVILKANYESKIAVMDSESFKKIMLKGTVDAPNAKAAIYFNSNSKEVYLTSMDMPELPTGKQYQLWAIINGKPVDAGMITEGDSTGKMKISPNATAFAISIENMGGSTTTAGPKGAVLVMGAV